MPRKPRFYIPTLPAHVIQRGNNRDAVFYDDDDYRKYKKWLHEGSLTYGCQIHAYVLMTNHIHLLMSANTADGIAKTMQHIGRHYVPYINKRYKRTGTLWEGRYKSNLVEAEPYLIACMRYIELNPVRAGMVKKPENYPWSSYVANACGEADPLITPHDVFKRVGRTASERRDSYQELFTHEISPRDLVSIRDCVQTGTPLVTEQFQTKIEQTLNRKVGYRQRGRPRKNDDK